MPESEYSAFMKYKEMKDKYDYMQGFNVNSKEDIAKTVAVFQCIHRRFTIICKFCNSFKFSKTQ